MRLKSSRVHSVQMLFRFLKSFQLLQFKLPEDIKNAVMFCTSAFIFVQHIELPLCIKFVISINLPCLALPCIVISQAIDYFFSLQKSTVVNLYHHRFNILFLSQAHSDSHQSNRERCFLSLALTPSLSCCCSGQKWVTCAKNHMYKAV